MKLKTLLLSSFLCLIVFMLGAALYGIYSLNSALNTYERDVREGFSNERAVYDLEIQYRIQMSEWKNLLLKSKSQENLDKYSDVLDKQQDLVSSRAKDLLDKLDAETRPHLSGFIATHNSLRDAYLKAKWDLTASAFDNAVADATLAGIDQKPSVQLQEVQRLIKASEQSVSTLANDTASTARWVSISIMVMFSIVGLFGSWVVASTVKKRIGGDPNEVVEIAKEISNGDLRSKLQVTNAINDSILYHFEHMRISLATLVQKVRFSAIGVSHASQEVGKKSDELSLRTEQQASAVEQTAASMDELSEKVANNASAASLAKNFAVDTIRLANNGGDAVSLVTETMRSIQASSKRMAEIISAIDGIAFQTNILALNAAVEAARAGDHGRGFAVVASEVRSLAARTLDAAKEIKSIINASVERVDIGTGQIEAAGTMMGEIVVSIGKVGDLISHIAVASSEQAASVSEIKSAVNLIDRVTQENSSLVESTLSVTSELANFSSELQRLVSEFQIDDAHTDARSETASAFLIANGVD